MDLSIRSLRLAPRLAALALLLLSAAASPALAQIQVHVPVTREPPIPPSPPDVDSISAWTLQAKAGFHAAVGDSVGGANYPAYEKVGLIARRLLRRLERRDLALAGAIQPTLDSLGFATEVATDPGSRDFALVLVRNPERYSADAVGYLFWYLGSDLRIQGLVFKGGYHPRMRVWRTATPQIPYECGVLDETRQGDLRFTLLRLSPRGSVWGIQQDETNFPLSGETGEAAWVDLNRDGAPEFVTWTVGPTDSLFTECMDCPKLLTERTYVEAGDGFDLQDQRMVPTPYSTLVYFVRLLQDGKLAQAEKLVRDPAKVRLAVAQGWNKRVVRKAWYVEDAEEGQQWPRRLAVRFEGPSGVKHYGVVFAPREGRWLIENWFEPKAVTRRFPSVTIPPAPAGAKPPAARPAKTPAKSPSPASAKTPAKASAKSPVKAPVTTPAKAPASAPPAKR